MARKGAPSKAASQRKGADIRIRVTAEQKRILQAAAEQDGLDVSAWLRSLGLKEAHRKAAT